MAESAPSPYVEQEDAGEGIRLIRLNRPERLNAFSLADMQELHRCLDHTAEDRDVRVVVLTGGGRGFCAGNDIRGGSDASGVPASWDRGPVATFEVQSAYSAVTLRMRSLPQPIIAAVNGPAAGGGFTLALAADLRYAAESAVFVASFVRIGLSGCDMGTSWLLSRLVGRGYASDLLLTGRIVGAAEARDMGIVLEVVEDGRVVERALEAARLIVRNSPFGVMMTKQVMWTTLEIPGLSASIDLENRTQVLASRTDDFVEASKAFRAGRDAEFRWR